MNLVDSFRWGAGVAFGARANLRFTAEVFGEVADADEVIAAPGIVTATDGSTSPTISGLNPGETLAFGVTYQHLKGFSLGVGVTYQFGLDKNDLITVDTGDTGNRSWGLQARIGFHNGVRLYQTARAATHRGSATTATTATATAARTGRSGKPRTDDQGRVQSLSRRNWSHLRCSC